jgi:hypothetical protein
VHILPEADTGWPAGRFQELAVGRTFSFVGEHRRSGFVDAPGRFGEMGKSRG